MRLLLLTIFLVLFRSLFQGAAAQGCPPNIGFEDGNFSNWELDPGNGATTPFPRHQIVSAASGNDRYGHFPKLCPYGGTYSARLGNERTGAESEHLSYTFRVPANQSAFTITYFYAIVLQNPDHTAAEQPRFTVRAVDAVSGAVIGCSTFDYVASGTLPGFESSDDDASVVYRKWTPGSIQIDGMAGRDVLLEFGTYDCTRGGHFGYAYVDVDASCANILATAPYCIESNALTLNAPFGYESYTWYNSTYSQVVGTGQTITLSPAPVTSGFFWVDVVPYPGYGCRDTFKATVTVLQNPPPPRQPDTLTYCQNQFPSPVSGVVQSPGCLLHWYSDSTGGLAALDPPRPSTLAPGLDTVWVSQKALYGCESKRVPIIIRVVSSWPLTFSVNSSRQCLTGNQFVFTNTSPPLAGATFTWRPEGSGVQVLPGVPFSYSYPAAGTHSGLFILSNAGACSRSVPVDLVVLPGPAAAITPSGENCAGLVAAPVRDASVTAPGDPIVAWWWEINGVVSTTPVPAALPLTSGFINARLAVRSAEGCRSDTVSRRIEIGDRPVAAFSLQTACSNDSASLRDASYVPGTGGQTVTGWKWSVDGNPLSNDQHPRVLLAGGAHRLQLVAESNLGCRSAAHDSLIDVRGAPRIGLQWSDSCAGTPLTFTVTDTSAGVQQWYWNIGSTAFSAGPAQRDGRYARAGRYPVAVTGTNAAGCTDTLRGFITIYDVAPPAFTDTLAAIAGPVRLDGGGSPGSRYQWQPALGLDSDTAARPLAFWDRDQRYTLRVETPQGCILHSQVLVRRMLGPDIYIPDAFTPNNDGKNDLLRPVVVGIRELHYFSVFDRNGQRVFHSTDTRSGWDGRIKGLPAGTATFVYIAEGIAYDGKRIFKKGTVTLIR
ncbi:T9SS type B sorting domain-containing protein [Flaviaesturariibacter flavus]|uniref:T9SS type B sorting domain-containing protein n=1 Tax=Flaviaesturariibacter flavus TaxID=2502780 RepID=A0A4R1BBK1_9BACT|nr:gliding motility-associated C-terminal domain-containing protein [Flaviaesturariibacter flavus]TCJ14391.1 T9SS type B sorting domain-containing protein [Flaviaesturariibacter flavus]